MALTPCAAPGRTERCRRLSKNFLATHQLDIDCWTALLCTAGRQRWSLF
jgi:hypothetical protein